MLPHNDEAQLLPHGADPALVLLDLVFYLFRLCVIHDFDTKP
jgi:hypothetical protein